MEAHRLKIHNRLKELCPNVYYQPGDSTTLKYPCIIYSLDDVDNRHADDAHFFMFYSWSVTIISRKANDPMFTNIYNQFQMIKMKSLGVTDQMYHGYYTIY